MDKHTIASSSSSLFNTHKKRIADLALKNRLPAIFDRGDFAESGRLSLPSIRDRLYDVSRIFGP